MRICFLNRGRDAYPGGDVIALDTTMDALRARGHFVEETGWDRQRIATGRFDLAHIFHCNFSWSWGNYEAVRDVGLPYVLTPIYYPGPLLSGVNDEQVMTMILRASNVIPFSRRENDEIGQELFRTNGRYFRHVIPNAADLAFHHSDDRAHMSTLDVLAVSARGDSDKNIAMVRAICERIGCSFTTATGLSRSELADMYGHHRVFVNASGSERMSLTIGEALCAGCRVLATDQNWGNEWYPGLVTFSPEDPLRLEHLIRWALSSRDWDYRPNAAARCLTWDWVAEKLEAVYKECLGS